MPQKKLHPDFIPDTETDDKSLKTVKSSTDLHPDFIPDSDEEEGQAESSEPSAWKSLTSSVSSWINEHPTIRRNVFGLTPEEAALTTDEYKKSQNPHYPFKDASRTELARNYLETPERGIISYKGKDIGSMYDELRNRNTDIYAGQPWKAAAASLATEPARFLTELANDPFVLASGGPGRVFSKAGGAFGDLKAARARVPQVTDLGTAPSTQKLLGPGPRFQAEPVEAEIVDTAAGQSIPIRQSREIPYRPTTDIVSGDISPVRTEPFPYKTPQPEIPTGRLAQSYSTAYGDTPRAAEARRRFAEQASRQPITDESRLLPEGVRQPHIDDLILSEEGKLPGEMSTSDALMYEPEFKPWKGLSILSEAILGRDIMKRDINAGLDPHRGPIDWGPIAEGETGDTPLISSRPKEVESPVDWGWGTQEESSNLPIRQTLHGEVLPAEEKFDIFGYPANRDLTEEEVRTIKKNLNKTLFDSYGEDTVEGQRAVDEINGIIDTTPIRKDLSETPKPAAKFKGWQQTGYEDMPDFPLYDVIAPGHESHGTTTDAAGLKKLGIEPPSEIPPNPHARVQEPEFARILDFPNKGNVPERLQAAKFVAEISDDRYVQALRKFESGRITADELNTIKAERDKALAEHSRLAEQSNAITTKRNDPLDEVKESINKISHTDGFNEVLDDFNQELKIARATGDQRRIDEINGLIKFTRDRQQRLAGNEPSFARSKPRKYEDLTPKRYKRYSVYDENDNLVHTTYDEAEAQRIADEVDGFVKDSGEKPGEGPLKARSEQGGIKIGQNIKRSAAEVTTGYSRPLPAIMVREGMQNAIDATRHLGKDGKIHIAVNNDGFSITDNGKGMNRKELETVFSDLYESGKTKEGMATGGKGIGKATYMLGGEHFKVETVSFQGGKKVKITAEGTPDEFSEHVPVNEEIVPLQTPTGTTITTKFKEGQDAYNAKSMASLIMDSTRNAEQKVTINRYGVDEPEKGFQSTKNEKIIHKSNIDGNDIVISMPKDELALKNRHSTEVHYLNNGMYQFSRYHYFDKETPFMPASVTVDIHPTAEEGTTGYPFPTQRESVKDALSEQIKDLINEKLAKPQQQAKQSKLRELYQSMPEVAVGTKRRAVLYDPGNRLTSAELTTLQRSPVVNQLIKHYDDFIGNVLNKIGNDKWSERLEGVGIVLDPGMHGVHIPNPDTGKSTILMNPFIRMGSHDPEAAALGTTFTGLHEVAHIGTEEGKVGVQLSEKDLADPRVGQYLQEYLHQVEIHGGLDMGHGIDFVKRLAEVLSKAGVEETFDAANEVKSIITDESGKLNPDAERILQIYSESRGRPETTEDLLSPTGEQSKSGRVGKGNTAGGNRSDGGGTPTERAVNKLFSAMADAKIAAEEQASNLRTERARRFAASAGVKAEGMEGAKKSLGKMKGEYEKSELPDSLKMKKEDVDSLFTAVKRANITEPEKLRGYTALFKLLNGEAAPVRSELQILNDVFGNGFGDKIVEMHGGIGLVGLKLAKTANTMKALQSSADLSAPLRQGIGLIHRPEWRDAFVEMFKYAAKPEYFKAAMEALEERPTYLLGREAGLFLAKPDSLLDGEEAFMNNYLKEVGQIPGKAGRAIGTAALLIPKGSERAYTGFLNKLRADTFDSLIKEARAAGHEAFTIAEHTDEEGNVKKIIVPSKTTENIAKYVNIATGRGNLGRLEKITPELNMLIWSPKLIKSRLDTLNPLYYASLDPFTRKQAIKSLFAIAAFGAITTSLAAITGVKVKGNPFSTPMDWFKDPTKKGEFMLGQKSQVLSADFGKMRLPQNQVLDPWAGFQQPIVAAFRFTSGSTDAGLQSRAATAGNFAANKLSPAASLAFDIASAKVWTGSGNYVNRFGQPANLPREVAKRFVPIFTQDLMDLAKSDNTWAEKVGLGTLSGLGMGVQDYPERAANKPRKMSLSF